MEENRHAPDDERDDVELLDPERVERVGERNRRDRRGSAEVAHDHQHPAAAATVDPRPGVQREEQVRDELRRDQIAHLRRVRVQHEHGGERDGDHRDLVAEERDRLAEPEPAEDEIPAQELGNEPHQRRNRFRAARATRLARMSDALPTPPPFQVMTVTTKAPWRE